MNILSHLTSIWGNDDSPFLINGENSISFQDISNFDTSHLEEIKKGDVVSVIGDFNPISIINILKLIEKAAIIVPLTEETVNDHDYFIRESLTDYVVRGRNVKNISHQHKNDKLSQLRESGKPGLILFSTGTTGRPKAILHDLSLFLKRFLTPRPTLKTLNFLLFDHIGGLNTLLHTLFNKGSVVAPKSRTVQSILATCRKHSIELLPTTPTFLRMLLLSGELPEALPSSLKIITYGTERMDQPTLNALNEILPNVEFRQTFGMSELGIVRVKSENSRSLFMKIGGEGIETRIVDNVLHIRSQSKMIGYLNAESPFDLDGWYNTNDIVEVKNDLIKIVGRKSEIINVGGLKFMAAEVEMVALKYPGVSHAKAYPMDNPITGQHVEIEIESKKGHTIANEDFKKYLWTKLPKHMYPRRIKFVNLKIGHRFKKL